MKSLTSKEKKAHQAIQAELNFCKTYAPELGDILYHVQQLAKAQDNLLVLTGKLSTEDRLARLRQTENILFEAAFNTVF